MVTQAGPDFSRLIAFAEKLRALDHAAWERIQAHCAMLDAQSLGGLLGRAELIARGLTPPTNPYTEPLWHTALSTLWTAAGVFSEVAMLLGGRSPERYEREADRVRQQPEQNAHAAGAAALLDVYAVALRQRPDHPGTAAALQAIATALIISPPEGEALACVYAPFEPEVPYASLLPSPGEHAA
jgi:hypothetical protein